MMTASARLSLMLACMALPVQAEVLKQASEVMPAGETLVYEIRWEPPGWMFFMPTVNAGELVVQFHGQTTLDGRPVYRITARAVSSGFLPKVTGITIDDSFESIVDKTEFCSCKMTKKLREGKRHRDIYLTFDRGGGQSRFILYDVAKTPPLQLKNEEVQNLPRCVQDVLSGIYLTRLRELRVGATFPVMISDNGIIKEIETRVTAKQPVQALAGPFSALKVETSSGLGTLFKGGGTFLIWFSDDERRLPVKFEAKVKLGKVFGTIKHYKR
jgi:Protein of unknown function (DUF3108)